MKFAEFDRTRHIAMGGRWLDSETGTWCMAGPGVLSLVRASPFLMKIFGCKEETVHIPGSTIVRSKALQSKWSETCMVAFECPPYVCQDVLMHAADRLYARSGDMVSSGSNVAFRPINSEPDAPVVLGHVHEIWVPDNNQRNNQPAFVAIHLYEWLPDDTKYKMPAVRKTLNLTLALSNDVLGVVNLQHRCAFSSCPETGQEIVRQERQDSSIMRQVIAHSDTINFVVNIYSIHNYDLIQMLLKHRFNMRARIEDPETNRRTRNHAAAHMRMARQKKKRSVLELDKHIETAVQDSNEPTKPHRKRQRKERQTDTAPVLAEDPAVAGPSNQPLVVAPLPAGQPVLYPPPAIYAVPPIYAAPPYPHCEFTQIEVAFY
ncbi:hypothetical protein CTheo_9041 [Ceratobasidium theobromae]|uniref:Uncharacterized protein n=1 Tax=Ceratobasidium theobromae TaxID=1582974 RepID=A0A5N5Q6N1_9AGAM|nr:hypothetical protein CTheo_9041 [Ceratobasidium theobromae]